MWIENLNIRNCRLLEDVSLKLSKNLNILVGGNASGKTSLLESLSILSNGRSFRTVHIQDVITHNKSSVVVTAKIRNDESISQIGIEKSQKKTKIRIDKKDIYSQAELSLHCPITVIHPDSVNLITGPPSKRRAFIDWLAFYLYPNFYNKWKSYRHILKQRNLCLKNMKHRYALDHWTEELVNLQPDINFYREKAVEVLEPIFKSISSDLLGEKVELIFKSGFPRELKLDSKSLLLYYEEKKELDLKVQRTTSGVHRADIIININQKSANESASRGQLKILVIALLLAQSRSINSCRSINGILLIDDFSAELDESNKMKLLEHISKLEQQIIITSTKDFEVHNVNKKMFHVKHGEIQEKRS